VNKACDVRKLLNRLLDMKKLEEFLKEKNKVDALTDLLIGRTRIVTTFVIFWEQSYPKERDPFVVFKKFSEALLDPNISWSFSYLIQNLIKKYQNYGINELHMILISYYFQNGIISSVDNIDWMAHGLCLLSPLLVNQFIIAEPLVVQTIKKYLELNNILALSEKILEELNKSITGKYWSQAGKLLEKLILSELFLHLTTNLNKFSPFSGYDIEIPQWIITSQEMDLDKFLVNRIYNVLSNVQTTMGPDFILNFSHNSEQTVLAIIGCKSTYSKVSVDKRDYEKNLETTKIENLYSESSDETRYITPSNKTRQENFFKTLGKSVLIFRIHFVLPSSTKEFQSHFSVTQPYIVTLKETNPNSKNFIFEEVIINFDLSSIDVLFSKTITESVFTLFPKSKSVSKEWKINKSSPTERYFLPVQERNNKRSTEDEDSSQTLKNRSKRRK